MSAIEVKKLLLDKGLTIAGMARQLRKPNQSQEAVRNMISQMIHGRRFYPDLAKRVERKFGVKLTRA